MSEFNLDNRSVLFKVAEKVEEGEPIEHIILAMIHALNTSKIKGIGLAAPQIGSQKRIILIDLLGIRKIIINPVITRRRLGTTNSIEMCLSFPGLKKKIRRDKQIIVEGFDEEFNAVKLKMRGLGSFLIQHEVDHLDGITIKDKKC